MKWYKRDPDAALSGMAELTFEECGAYNRLLDLLYSRDGNVPDDDRFCASVFHCDPRTWRALKARLIAKGKVRVNLSGNLTANRVELELKLSLERIARARRMRQIQLENQRTEPATPPGQPHPQPQPDKKERSASRSKERRARTRLPENWQPEIEWDETEDFQRFCDHARTNARLCADWEAAWRNWKRKTVELKQKDKQNGRRHGSVLDACDRLGEKLKAAGATDDYIPGSSGPKPLELVEKMFSNGPKLISSR